MKGYIKSNEYINMSSEKRGLMIKLLSAMQEKVEVLPKQLNLEKAEKERLEEIVKHKALEAAMAKVDKVATKTKAKAESASALQAKRKRK